MDAVVSKYHYYYDQMYSLKDYRAEVEMILAVYEKYSSQTLGKALDIGCGTGNHSVELAKRG